MSRRFDVVRPARGRARRDGRATSARCSRAEYGITEPLSDRFNLACYRALGLVSFFTVGEDEVRAWTIRAGDDAVTAAGKIHTDLASGFIRAEVTPYDDLRALGTMREVKANGKQRLEGRELQGCGRGHPQHKVVAMKLPRAGILTVGDELLGGRVVNTNAAFLTQRLTEQGFLVTVTETVGDEEFAIADAIEALCQRTDAVVVAGGLGPTPDDVTREALAGASGALLVVDDAAEAPRGDEDPAASPRARTSAWPACRRAPRRSSPTPSASRPACASTWAVPRSTPCRAFRWRWRRSSSSRSCPTSSASSPRRSRRNAASCGCYGLREAEVAERLGDLLDRGKEPSVGVTVKYGLITVSVVGHGAAKRADQIREELGAHVIGEDHDTPATVAYRMLLERGLTLATAESITGGLVAGLFIDQPGASEVSAAASSPTTTTSSTSCSACRRRSSRARAPFPARWHAAWPARPARPSASTSRSRRPGSPGPTPDERGVPIGRGFLAVAGPRAGKTGEVVEAFSCVGNRNAIRRRFVWTALDLVRRHLARGRSKKVG